MKLLFLCTGNSCRSQMAEGWTRALRGEIEVWSAGVEARGLDPRAVLVMREAGIDTSAQRSRRLDQLGPLSFDVVVTVCGEAHERCPILPDRTRVIHVPFDDPPRLAGTGATDEQALAHYRRVRDEIRHFVETLPGALESG